MRSAKVEMVRVAVGQDAATRAHSLRVRGYAVGLAQELGLSTHSDIKAIDEAALFHDIGKAAIPPQILNKPGPLTNIEYEEIKRHVDLGAEMLSGYALHPEVVPIVRAHHENWDGTGYSRGLVGAAIPLGARIVSVVDCFDALTSDRPYRGRLAAYDALKIVRDRRGTMYEPAVVDAFLRLCQRTPNLGDSDAHS